MAEQTQGHREDCGRRDGGCADRALAAPGSPDFDYAPGSVGRASRLLSSRGRTALNLSS